MSKHSPPPPGAGGPQLSPDMASAMQQFTGSQKNSTQTSGGASGNSQTSAPRPVGTPVQEVQYFAQDVAKGLTNVLPDAVQEVLGMKLNDPQQQARRKQMLEKFNQLTESGKIYADKRFREEQEKKRQADFAEQRRRQLQAEQKQKADTSAPSGKRTGMMAGQSGNSNKKATTDLINKQRNTLADPT